MRRCSEAGRALIKRFEGLRLTAYADPGTGGAPWTIGYGHTGGVCPGDVITAKEAEALFAKDIRRCEQDVEILTDGLKLSDGAFAALCSFVFNVGSFRLARSTLLMKLRAGDTAGAADQLLLWTRAAGAVLPGLTKRRTAERALFLGVPPQPKE